MDFKLSFKVNDTIYLRDPEGSELGRSIVKNAIDMMYELGFESFTFKKLATEMKTTEASVYRYFENKHKLLLYILNWYWSYLEFLVVFHLQNMKDPKTKLNTVIQLLTEELPESNSQHSYNNVYLNQIVIAESSKGYLVKEIDEINKNQVFKPYKDLCTTVADIIHSYNPKYKYPRSLSSTIIETAHHQQFFCASMPRLTDNSASKSPSLYTSDFIKDFVFKTLG